MDRIGDILVFLRDKKDYVSGDFIASQINISRTAIWKYINQLEKKGYRIEKLKGKGYRLMSSPDKLFPWEIGPMLDTKFIGNNIIYMDEVDSTNTHAFKLALSGAPEGTCVVAEQQKSGKGRLGRTWFSPEGRNLCVSVILRPSIPPAEAYPITFISSLAVYDTIREVSGLVPALKWPNDVLIGSKKICGTLIELSTETDLVRFVVVGIGLNIMMGEEELDHTIMEKATSLYIETGTPYNRASVCGKLLSNLEKYYMIFNGMGNAEICDMWEKRAAIKGKFLEVRQLDEEYKGVCLGIDADGALLLDINGRERKIIAGDVIF